MMTLQQTLLALLLLVKPSDEDVKLESANDRLDRMTMIADAIADASVDVVCKGSEETQDQKRYCWPGSAEELSILLVTKAWSETKFTKRIHEGKCFDNECDPVWSSYTFFDKKHNKNVTTRYVAYHRAKSPWQIHYQEFMTKDNWKSINGANYQSTFLAAQGAAKILAFGRNRCGGWNPDAAIERAMALYATGKTCVWSGTKNRMWLFQHLQKKASDRDLMIQTLLDNGISINIETFNSKLIAYK